MYVCVYVHTYVHTYVGMYLQMWMYICMYLCNVTKVMLESDYSSHLDLRQIDHEGDRGIKLDQGPMAKFRVNWLYINYQLLCTDYYLFIKY